MRRNHPQTQLQMADLDIGRARLILKARLDTLHLLADPLTGTDYDNDATSRNGHSDPTPAQADQLERWHQMEADIEKTCKELAKKALHLCTLLNAVPVYIGPDNDRYRCTGGKPSTESWTRPECERNATTRDGLCDACYQRRHHWRSVQQAAS